MTINIMEFAKGLNLPPSVTESLSKERTNEELEVYCKTLPQLLYPDTYKLAGKLFIHLNIKSAPKSMKDYVDVLDGVLQPYMKTFILENQEAIDKLLEETYHNNFDYDIMSASACVNYLLRLSPDEESIETPCHLYLRQAIQFYYEDGMEKVEKCYREFLDKQYVHASPTMFNAGTTKNQMSSCFLLTIGDNLQSLLYTGVGDVGMISKAQGGIGLSLNNIRHSSISNTGNSSGVLPFAEIYDSTIKCIDQGGKRNGAMTITLIDWHIDFLDFIQCRDNYTQNGIRLKRANICAYLSSEFMRRVRNNQKWTLFCPSRAVIEIDGKEVKLIGLHSHEFDKYYSKFEEEAERRNKEFEELDKFVKSLEKKMNSGNMSEEEIVDYHKMVIRRTKARKKLIVHKTVQAVDVYDKLCDMQIKSSMPYIVYRDTVNYKNNMKNLGTVEGLNLCLEITEPSTPDSIASCNLAHINLKRFVLQEYKDGKDIKDCYDFNGLGNASRSLVRNLNKVIDYNRYPLDEFDDEGNVTKRGKISTPNLDNRPLGIGVSGLAEVFANLDIAYDDPVSYQINKMIFACMYFNCLKESCAIAIENEKRSEWKEFGFYKSFEDNSFEAFHEGEWKQFVGSPLCNGFFQFDMWKQEADYLRSIGSLDERIYKPENDKPVNPEEWGQQGSWENLRMLIMRHGVYNSMFLAPMPTASSAQMLNNAETTEAHQALVYSRKLAHGNYTSFSEPFINDMIKYNLWNQKTIDFVMLNNGSIKGLHEFMLRNKDYYPEEYFKGEALTEDFEKMISHLQRKHRGMYEISQKVCLDMTRQRGIYVDQSQSHNVYFPEPNMRQLKAVHDYSERLRVKTGMYYLRSNPAAQTGRFTVDIETEKKQKEKQKVVCTDEVCIMCQ
jgi:ribonucleotide reductase alpha subunit